MKGHAHNFIDITGQKFGRLTVVEYVGKGQDRKALWKCKCDCGEERVVRGRDLRNGKTVSCGCYREEIKIGRPMTEQNRRILLDINTTHGLSKTPIYKVWQGIKSRCYNPKTINYCNYGGRGITMCEEWLTFEGFYEDMAESYKRGLTIERIDNDKGYSKENCKWATRLEQSNNKRDNIIITYNGETDTLANLCRKYNKKYITVADRYKRGWGVDKLFI